MTEIVKRTFFGELIHRLTSTPIGEFFKKIVVFGAILASIGTSIVGLNATGVKLPPIFITASGYFIGIGAAIAAVASTTTKSTTPDPSIKIVEKENV